MSRAAKDLQWGHMWPVGHQFDMPDLESLNSQVIFLCYITCILTHNKMDNTEIFFAYHAKNVFKEFIVLFVYCTIFKICLESFLKPKSLPVFSKSQSAGTRLFFGMEEVQN